MKQNFIQHAWQQWSWVWHAIAYIMMALNLTIALGNSLRRGSFQTTAWLTILLAIWYVPFMMLPARQSISKPWKLQLYFIIGLVIWMALIYFHTPAMMLAALFYPQVFIRLPFRWAMVSAVLFTVSTFYLGFILPAIPDDLPTLYVVGVLLVSSQAILGGFINSLISQSSQRYRLLNELEETRFNLLKAERETAILSERQRLSREIHDTLAQDFTSIIMSLNAAKLTKSSMTQVYLDQAEQIARDGLNDARRIVWALRLEELENNSFTEAIERLTARWSAEAAVCVNSRLTGSPKPLGAEYEATLLRITQEALHNIKKHAHAQEVNITLSYMPDLFALDIADNGIGFEQRSFKGFGLKTMRERIEEIGGSLVIESQLGVGTTIAVSLPLEEQG
ncbi:MAG: sensor histidine kinase [Anaerolineales bacterium]